MIDRLLCMASLTQACFDNTSTLEDEETAVQPVWTLGFQLAIMAAELQCNRPCVHCRGVNRGH